MTQRIKNVQPRSASTRTAIVDAVRTLWSDREFDAITVADIAKTAKIAKGSVMAHFSEKLIILAALLATELEKISLDLEVSPKFAATPESLTTALRPLLDYLLADRALVRVLTTSGDGAQCESVLNPSLTRFSDGLRAGFTQAELRSPDLCTEVLIALIVHVTVSCQGHDGKQAQQQLQRLVSVLYR